MGSCGPAALVFALLAWMMPLDLQAQVVKVTAWFDPPSVQVGDTAIFHVAAQVMPQPNIEVDRIFSWHVDLVNERGQVARVDHGRLVKPLADRDPRTSSAGVADGAHVRGIYDTFMNLAGAGRDGPVELFFVPVQGLAPGRAMLRVSAGTGTNGLAADFLVAPVEAHEPLLGGDYASALAELDVNEDVRLPSLGIKVTPARPGQSMVVTLNFLPWAGRAHVVEFRDLLLQGSDWRPVAGAPHNSGVVTDSPEGLQRYYRLQVSGD